MGILCILFHMRCKRTVAPPPFKVERMSGSTLVGQVAGGLRHAIASGIYKPGDILPSITDLAESLGVSRIVTRTAVKMLADERLIYSRPSAGSVVLDAVERRWKGRILLVQRTNGCGYYDNVFTSTLRRLFTRAGWLCLSAYVMNSPEGTSCDVSEIKAMVTNNVNLAIVLFDNPAAEKILSESGVPFAVLGDKVSCRRRGCRGYLHYDRSAQDDTFAAVCLAEGVRSVVHVGMRDFDDVRSSLRKAGISCKSWILKEPSPGRPPDAYAELARDAFAEMLKSGKPLPDVFYFSDDYFCAGALAALSDAGIYAPRDVRIATWANRGNVPAYARELSRIELDPWHDAETACSFCLAVLAGEQNIKPPVFAPSWIDGKTLKRIS